MQPRRGPLMHHLQETADSANFLLFVDTHSDYETGGICHGTGPNRELFMSPVDEVKHPRICLNITDQS
jgi:hypothetical protein